MLIFGKGSLVIPARAVEIKLIGVGIVNCKSRQRWCEENIRSLNLVGAPNKYAGFCIIIYLSLNRQPLLLRARVVQDPDGVAQCGEKECFLYKYLHLINVPPCS